MLRNKEGLCLPADPELRHGEEEFMVEEDVGLQLQANRLLLSERLVWPLSRRIQAFS